MTVLSVDTCPVNPCLPPETNTIQPARAPTSFFRLFSFLSATNGLWIRLAVLSPFTRIYHFRPRHDLLQPQNSPQNRA
jgi:hypothetical protein